MNQEILDASQYILNASQYFILRQILSEKSELSFWKKEKCFDGNICVHAVRGWNIAANIGGYGNKLADGGVRFSAPCAHKALPSVKGEERKNTAGQ